MRMELVQFFNHDLRTKFFKIRHKLCEKSSNLFDKMLIITNVILFDELDKEIKKKFDIFLCLISKRLTANRFYNAF